MSAVVPSSPNDRIQASVRKIVRETLPTIRFLGTYEYTVEATSGTTCSGSPTDDSQGLPPMALWPMRSCVCGGTAIPSVGMSCLVTFANGDPSRPIVVGIEGPPEAAIYDATVEVIVGRSSSIVSLGPAPEPLALGTPLATALTELGTLFATLATAAASTATWNAGLGSTTPAALTAAADAMTAGAAAVPTKVVGGS